MKNLRYLWIAVLCLMLIGCSRETVNSDINSDTNSTVETAEDTDIADEAVEPLKLQIISEEYNNIDWANDWYERENLSLPMIGNEWNHFYDDTYEYLWAGDELYIFDRQISNSDTHCLYVLQYPTDKWYINGNNAWLKDGIFYGASVTNGYAGPDSCFMFAYDLEQDKLLWRSADQSYIIP